MKAPQFIKNIYFRYFFRVKKGKCLFVPHPGFTKLDKASIINYKADNCLIFVRYLLEQELYLDKELVVVSTTPERAQREQDWCREHYPKANIRIIPNVSRVMKSEWAKSEYIFMSEDKFPYRKKKGQQYICLSYYPLSLKNDYFDPNIVGDFQERVKFASEIDWISSTSLLNSQIDSASLSLPMNRFHSVGKCRSDVLLLNNDVSYVKKYFMDQCMNYTFSTLILYTPTHRDYESAIFDIQRSILGFNVNRQKFENFLKENKILIVCKLHPTQNMEVVESDLPDGVINFKGSEQFGLIELMKVSDILMTDYTSTYVDYLLLDKPVIFNFYDLNLYSSARGLAFYPFQRICAGEIFTDEKSFYTAVESTLNNPEKYKNKRAEILEEMMTHRTDVCANTYNMIFENSITNS